MKQIKEPSADATCLTEVTVLKRGMVLLAMMLAGRNTIAGSGARSSVAAKSARTKPEKRSRK
ncbi:MAG TPA: hypothetical protein VGO08_03115 [Burkholderiales bacterium]|nr:hypothetical protein [Burkholderiales bacterium]